MFEYANVQEIVAVETQTHSHNVIIFSKATLLSAGDDALIPLIPLQLIEKWNKNAKKSSAVMDQSLP